MSPECEDPQYIQTSSNVNIGSLRINVFTEEDLQECATTTPAPSFVGKSLPDFAQMLWEVNAPESEGERKLQQELRPVTETSLGSQTAYTLSSLYSNSGPCGGAVSHGEVTFITTEYMGMKLILSYPTLKQAEVEPILNSMKFTN